LPHFSASAEPSAVDAGSVDCRVVDDERTVDADVDVAGSEAPSLEHATNVPHTNSAGTTCSERINAAADLTPASLTSRAPEHNRRPCDGQTCRVQFSAELRDRVADGTITVSYRLWSRPLVKVGGVYRSGSVEIQVDDIEMLPFSSITAEDLACTGEPDLESLRHRAAHAGPIEDGTILYRVEFHVVPATDRTQAPDRDRRTFRDP
jgi:hypothetical protein